MVSSCSSSMLCPTFRSTPQCANCSTLFLHRECTRGGFCNFMHLKPISRELRRELYGRRRKRYGAVSCLKVDAHNRTFSSHATVIHFVKFKGAVQNNLASIALYEFEIGYISSNPTPQLFNKISSGRRLCCLNSRLPLLRSFYSRPSPP